MKKLQRSRTNKVFFGVCGGLAEYLGLDPVAVRLIFVLVTLFGGMGVVAYIVGVIIIPESPEEEKVSNAEANDSMASPPLPQGPAEPKSDKSAEIVGIVLIMFGVIFMLKKIAWMDRYFDWLTFHFWSLLLPIILLVLGVSLIMRSKKK